MHSMHCIQISHTLVPKHRAIICGAQTSPCLKLPADLCNQDILIRTSSLEGPVHQLKNPTLEYDFPDSQKHKRRIMPTVPHEWVP